MAEKIKQQTLAEGAPLTAETFADFVERLRYDCEGERVKDHWTADAFFVVQNQHIVYGLDMDYTDKRCVIEGESTYFSPQEYWDSADAVARANLDDVAIYDEESPFLECDTDVQWDILGDLEDHTVTGWAEEWETINFHFTHAAAQAFIDRKSHDYRKLRIYADAHTYGWEYNAIKQALLDGTLVFNEKEG